MDGFPPWRHLRTISKFFACLLQHARWLLFIVVLVVLWAVYCCGCFHIVACTVRVVVF